MAGYARIGLYPNLGVTWWTTMLVGADRPVVASVAYDLPVAGGHRAGHRRRRVDMRGAVVEPLRGDEPPGDRAGPPARRARRRVPGVAGRAHHRRRSI